MDGAGLHWHAGRLEKGSFLLIPLLLVAIDASATGLHSVLHWEALAVYPCFAVAALLASRWRGQVGCSVLCWSGRLLTGLLFLHQHGLMAQQSVSAYSRDLAGWLQAVTTGEPGHLPSWWFLRNSFVSDLGFSLLLLAAYNTEAAFRHQQRIPLRQPLAA